MARIKLAEQGAYEFQYRTAIQPRDINYAWHLSNDALVSLVGAARAHMFHVTGFTELDLGDGVTGVIMSDLAVNYKAEAQMFDELTIDTHVGEFSRNSFRTFHRVTKGDLVVALAESGLVTFNYTTRKLAPVPEVFLKTLIEFTNAGS